MAFAAEMVSLGIFFKSSSKRIMHSRCLAAHSGRVTQSIGKVCAGILLSKPFNMAVMLSLE